MFRQFSILLAAVVLCVSVGCDAMLAGRQSEEDERMHQKRLREYEQEELRTPPRIDLPIGMTQQQLEKVPLETIIVKVAIYGKREFNQRLGGDPGNNLVFKNDKGTYTVNGAPYVFHEHSLLRVDNVY